LRPSANATGAIAIIAAAAALNKAVLRVSMVVSYGLRFDGLTLPHCNETLFVLEQGTSCRRGRTRSEFALAQ
jgi:hypothetical protein